MFPANQEPTKSTCHKQPVTSNNRAGSRADSGPVITDQESWSNCLRCFGGKYVYWFQKNNTVILSIDINNNNIDSDDSHPQKDDFSAVNKQNGFELLIQTVKLSHSATYCCFCRRVDLHSDTRSERPERKPTDVKQCL